MSFLSVRTEPSVLFAVLRIRSRPCGDEISNSNVGVVPMPIKPDVETVSSPLKVKTGLVSPVPCWILNVSELPPGMEPLNQVEIE